MPPPFGYDRSVIGSSSGPDVRARQIGMFGQQPARPLPALRAVIAAVGQAGQAAELVRGVGRGLGPESGFPAVFGDGLQVSRKPWPAGEPVLAGEGLLSSA